MHILALSGKEDEGAYSIKNSDGKEILLLFEEEDDAVRYALMLEDDGYPEISVMEVDDELMINVCEAHEYQYAIITKNDLVVPPKTKSKRS